jgi:hypothetical protein
MNNVRTFLSARDLCALSQTCAHARKMVPDVVWSHLICARFPLYPRALIGVARETLLLLEDRAHDGHAAAYHARSNVKPEEIADPASRTMMSICSAGFIDGMISISREYPILRGDIIIDDYGTSGFDAFIFDGEFAHRCTADIFLSMIELPRAIKIGAEFNAEYFKRVLNGFTQFNVFLDVNRANYTSIRMCKPVLDRNRCVLVYGNKYCFVSCANCATIDEILARAKNYPARVDVSDELACELSLP